ncbi:MAG: hypothetical protein ABR501_12275 [Pyrinomonadaceae bacterium]
MKTIILSLLILTSCTSPGTQTQQNEAVSQKPTQLKLTIPKAGRPDPRFTDLVRRIGIMPQ